MAPQRQNLENHDGPAAREKHAGATDRLSEGVDLHRYCRHLIHYELRFQPRAHPAAQWEGSPRWFMGGFDGPADFDAGLVTIALPDSGKRLMSLGVIRPASPMSMHPTAKPSGCSAISPASRASCRSMATTPTVERSIRGIKLSRKNALFAGSDGGAEHWAVVASLVETCKLNDIDPLAYLTDALIRIVNGYPNRDIDQLLPWAYHAQALKAVA